jgi:hypothetical protein
VGWLAELRSGGKGFVLKGIWAQRQSQAEALHTLSRHRAFSYGQLMRPNSPSPPCLPPSRCSLEDALKQQAGELERRGRDWAAREAALSSGHSRSHGATAAAHAELGVAQDALDAAAKRVRALEGDNAELRKQKAQVAADKRMLEELLADSDAERRWAAGGRAGGQGLVLQEGMWCRGHSSCWLVALGLVEQFRLTAELTCSIPALWAPQTILPYHPAALPCPCLPAYLPTFHALPAGICMTSMCGWGSAWRPWSRAKS